MRTHPVVKLLEQYCYKSAAGLLQLVRFYMCNLKIIGNAEFINHHKCVWSFAHLKLSRAKLNIHEYTASAYIVHLNKQKSLSKFGNMCSLGPKARLE